MNILARILCYLVGLVLGFVGMMAAIRVLYRIPTDASFRSEPLTVILNLAADVAMLCLSIYLMHKALERKKAKVQFDDLPLSDRALSADLERMAAQNPDVPRPDSTHREDITP